MAVTSRTTRAAASTDLRFPTGSPASGSLLQCGICMADAACGVWPVEVEWQLAKPVSSANSIDDGAVGPLVTLAAVGKPLKHALHARHRFNAPVELLRVLKRDALDV